MTSIPMTLLSASVTVLIAVFYFYTAFRVGNLRARHAIKAPACSGHPEFDRAYRVQMNTLEQMGIVLPLLWVAALYPISWGWLAPLVGFIWVIARIIYMRSYMADPEKRITGAMMSGFCDFVLLILAISGIALAWQAAIA